MADSGINLKSLLLGDAPESTISACTAAAGAAARRGSERMSGVDWPELAGDIGEKVGEMFDIPLVGLLTDAWRDFQELRDAAGRGGDEAGAPATVALIDHELEASFKPHLDVVVSGTRAARIEFEISAGLELHAVELVVWRGAIRAVRVGSCLATAKVSCQGLPLFERRSRRLDLPGEIALPRAIPIGRRD